jgi:hypothetical protein
MYVERAFDEKTKVFTYLVRSFVNYLRMFGACLRDTSRAPA